MRQFALLLIAAVVPVLAHAAEIPAAIPIVTVQAATPILVKGRVRVDSPMPLQLNVADRAAYRQIFTDIHNGRFAQAAAGLDRMPSNGLLTATGRAELWLSPGSPRPSNEALTGWLATNTGFPQAERIVALARRAGIRDLPVLPPSVALRAVQASAREKPRSTRADAFAARVQPLLATDRLAEAGQLLGEASLDSDARTEWSQRIAWAYYLAGDDAHALPLATQAAGGSGEWAAMGNWVAGLSFFRTGDFVRAADHFAKVSTYAHSPDLAAAGYFWAARAETASGRPERVQAYLRTAGRYGDSFYALLARRLLGIALPPRPDRPDFLTADWRYVEDVPGARRAAALVEIGELGLADRELRYLAMTGPADRHVPLTYLAAKLNLPATQYWLANNAPPGVTPPVFTRYPAPEWEPARGWRVDRSLVYAHALQESRFVTDAKSRAGARGVMQLMPGTARDLARGMAVTGGDTQLTDPSFNIEFGQTYLETLRDSPWTEGLLPKVIAAYNAGPGSLKNWVGRLREDDPLLYIESIPFAETRHYVEIVLRNYWMYQQGDGVALPSLDAMAQGLWPRFPGMPGAPSVRR